MDRDIASSPLAPITVRIREACRITGIGRSKLYELIAAGEIETIKVGAITLLPVSGIERFLKRCATHLAG
ncbi:helix-turn-helix domain-containing protein [Sphingomonas sp. PR090111-T3T-6A]|uniref:helix-turn-helix domain-containing protein n=1 Tax=Sphingomonas sp. PR090111-T3T-6A TaxID=685778 RepID=UPI00036ABE03|nr:helix-turn-helix domain-containing protein [Sphingomonas sp. PR090111-T3T-6A]